MASRFTLLPYLIAAILLHFNALILYSVFYPKLKMQLGQKERVRKLMPVKMVSLEEEFKQLRRFGVADGTSPLFSLPASSGKYSRPKKRHVGQVKPELPKVSPELSSLAVHPERAERAERAKLDLPPQEGHDKSSPATTGFSSVEARPRDLGIGMNLVLPEGISPEEMNALEFQLYSFNTRLYKRLLELLNRSIAGFISENPQVRPDQFFSQNVVLRVTYSAEGEVQSVTFVGENYNEMLKNFFQKMFAHATIHNPPQKIFKGNPFTYQYNINFI